MQYYLSEHVFACIANERLVFLDLKEDRYFSLDREKSRAIARVLLGYEPRSSLIASNSPTNIDDVAQDLQALIDAKILSRDPTVGKRWETSALPAPTRQLADSEAVAEAHLGVVEICRFFWACINASYALRWTPLQKTVEKLDTWKARSRMSTEEFDFNRAHMLVSKFTKLRPLYPREYLCLFDSLSLITFLASYGVFPTWVFGVKDEPFAAHCWIQEADRSFNEAHEVAASYTPILAI